MQISTSAPFHAPIQYQYFPPNPYAQLNEYSAISRTIGHPPHNYPILQKYSPTPNTLYFEFCGSTIHSTKQCWVLDALVDQLDHTAFYINENSVNQGGG